MPRCYMVKKGGARHLGDPGPPPCSPTEATVAPSCYSPGEHSALIEPRGANYAELSNRPLSERSAADTEAAHELLSLAQSVPPLPQATLLTVVHTPQQPPLVPVYTYTLQPTNIYILSEEPVQPVYTAVPTLASVQPVEYATVASQVNYVAYQTVNGSETCGTQVASASEIPSIPPIVHHNQISQPLQSPSQNHSKEESNAIIKEKSTRYDCNICGKRYATSSNLSRHKQTHRSLDSVAAKRCGECGKAYVSMPALAMHVLTHRMGHVCGVCGKQFSRPWLLRGHLRLHTGEKPYGCSECGKKFADRSNLRAHLQTHSSDKKYVCRRCRKSFALRSYLNKHQESACACDDQ